MVSLSIANTISALIQGNVLGLGTTTIFDNGELTFLHQPGAARTHLYKCQSLDGGIRRLLPGDGASHFPSWGSGFGPSGSAW